MLSSNHKIVRVLSTSLFVMLTGGGLRGTLRLSSLHPCAADDLNCEARSTLKTKKILVVSPEAEYVVDGAKV